jgi:hypothetical protein
LPRTGFCSGVAGTGFCRGEGPVFVAGTGFCMDRFLQRPVFVGPSYCKNRSLLQKPVSTQTGLCKYQSLVPGFGMTDFYSAGFYDESTVYTAFACLINCAAALPTGYDKLCTSTRFLRSSALLSPPLVPVISCASPSTPPSHIHSAFRDPAVMRPHQPQDSTGKV